MEPDKAKAKAKANPKTPRDEFEVACYTEEPGRTIQRRMLQQQMESSGCASNSAHGEDSSFDSPSSPPQHDRAG
jgi:hypothetical protein